MKVISNPTLYKHKFSNVVLAIGVFDGVHIGHQSLIKQTIERAHFIGGRSAVMTFDPHPVQVLHPEVNLPLIVSFEHRLKLLSEMGVELCFAIQFTKRFSEMSPPQFIKQFIVRLIKAREVFVGDDFRFGHNREGGIDYFKKTSQELSFRLNPIHPVKENRSFKVSSTHIRQMISEGKLSQAKKLLGRTFSILGKVVHGDSRGKALGFPTANIYPNNLVLPPLGVYAVKIRIGQKKYDGVANVGRRPSFKNPNNKVNIEVHLFHFHRDIYDADIEVEFIKHIRNEKVFYAKEELVKQIKKDIIKAQQILK